MIRLVFVILILLVIPLSVVSQEAAQTPVAAPVFRLKDLQGRLVSLNDYKGKVILLNFWATWCAPCRAETPELVKWQKLYQSRGLQILAVTFPPYKLNAVRQFVRKFRVNYPTLFATTEISKSYEVGDVLPLTVILDRDGRIRDRILGILEPEEFEEKIKPLLN